MWDVRMAVAEALSARDDDRDIIFVSGCPSTVRSPGLTATAASPSCRSPSSHARSRVPRGQTRSKDGRASLGARGWVKGYAFNGYARKEVWPSCRSRHPKKGLAVGSRSSPACGSASRVSPCRVEDAGAPYGRELLLRYHEEQKKASAGHVMPNAMPHMAELAELQVVRPCSPPPAAQDVRTPKEPRGARGRPPPLVPCRADSGSTQRSLSARHPCPTWQVPLRTDLAKASIVDADDWKSGLKDKVDGKLCSEEAVKPLGAKEVRSGLLMEERHYLRACEGRARHTSRSPQPRATCERTQARSPGRGGARPRSGARTVGAVGSAADRDQSLERGTLRGFRCSPATLAGKGSRRPSLEHSHPGDDWGQHGLSGGSPACGSRALGMEDARASAMQLTSRLRGRSEDSLTRRQTEMLRGGREVHRSASTDSRRPEERFVTRPWHLKREVRALLNKISPENEAAITVQLLGLPLESAEDFETIASLTIEKAMSDPFYSEIYARAIGKLCMEYAVLPVKDKEDPQGAINGPDGTYESTTSSRRRSASPRGLAGFTSFAETVLDLCRRTFDDILRDAELLDAPPGSEEEDLNKAKSRALAYMRLLGHLYKARIVCTSSLQQYVNRLLLVPTEGPQAGRSWPRAPKAWIECLCELLHTVGRDLSRWTQGKAIVKGAMERLEHWKELRSGGPGAPCALPPRIQFLIQDVSEASRSGWPARSDDKGVPERSRCRMPKFFR